MPKIQECCTLLSYLSLSNNIFSISLLLFVQETGWFSYFFLGKTIFLGRGNGNFTHSLTPIRFLWRWSFTQRQRKAQDHIFIDCLLLAEWSKINKYRFFFNLNQNIYLFISSEWTQEKLWGQIFIFWWSHPQKSSFRAPSSWPRVHWIFSQIGANSAQLTLWAFFLADCAVMMRFKEEMSTRSRMISFGKFFSHLFFSLISQ